MHSLLSLLIAIAFAGNANQSVIVTHTSPALSVGNKY